MFPISQSALASHQQNNYVSVAILTTVIYDYVLTLSDEVEYIWAKPWTWVSTLFILLRYAGLYNIVFYSLIGSNFLPAFVKVLFPVMPGTQKLTEVYTHRREVTYIVNLWLSLVFLGAADSLMMLRVWAIYNRSMPILGALLVLFALEIIATISASALYSSPKNLAVTTSLTLGSSYCTWQPRLSIATEVAAAVQIVHCAVMCVLALFQFFKLSLQMYRVTKEWRLSRYIKVLAKQGVLYFLIVCTFDLLREVTASGIFPKTGWQAYMLTIMQYVPMYTLIPRFMLSIRKLYAHDVGQIDSGFGLLSSDEGSAVEPVVVFAKVQSHNELEDVDSEVDSIRVGATSSNSRGGARDPHFQHGISARRQPV